AHRHAAPAQFDVRMMVLGFGHRPDAIDEGEGASEVVEAPGASEAPALLHLPALQFGEERTGLDGTEGRSPFGEIDASTVGERLHDAPSCAKGREQASAAATMPAAPSAMRAMRG